MKKVLAMMLAMVMLFALCACGSDASQPAGDSGTSAESQATEQPEAAGSEQGEAEPESEPEDEVKREAQFITLATGTANGANYQALAGISNMMAKKWSEYTFAPEVTNGSAENIRMMASGAAQIACSQADSFYYANIGEREFDASTVDTINFVVCGNETVITMIVRADSGINSFADMKGKRAAVGSGTIYQAYWPLFLEEYGFTEDDVAATPMNMADCATALQDGTADMIFYNANFPHPTFQDLALNCPVRFLDVEQEVKDHICEQNPYFAETIIPADVYDTEKDVETIGTRTAIICRPDTDEQLIYDLCATIFENQEEIALLGPTVAEYNPENALKFSDLVPMHPGAERYYKEHGMM